MTTVAAIALVIEKRQSVCNPNITLICSIFDIDVAIQNYCQLFRGCLNSSKKIPTPTFQVVPPPDPKCLLGVWVGMSV